jgi:hypothetical protein
MWPKLRSAIPRHNRTRNTHDKPDDPPAMACSIGLSKANRAAM